MISDFLERVAQMAQYKLDSICACSPQFPTIGNISDLEYYGLETGDDNDLGGYIVLVGVPEGKVTEYSLNLNMI